MVLKLFMFYFVSNVLKFCTTKRKAVKVNLAKEGQKAQ